MTADKGIGYWFFGWTPSAVADPSILADVQQEWGSVRHGFGLLNERDGWIGKSEEIVEAEGKKAGYRSSTPGACGRRTTTRTTPTCCCWDATRTSPRTRASGPGCSVFVRPAEGDPEAA